MRIHYHTDCFWFSGSETTLLILLEAAFTNTDVEPVFTYRAWPEYETGLRARLSRHVYARPVRLPDPMSLKVLFSRGSPRPVARVVRGAVSLLPIKKLCLAWDVGRMYKEFRRTRPEIVHINNGGFPGAISCNAAAIAARLARVPAVLYVVNNMAVSYRNPRRWLDYPVDRAVTRSVDLFITGSAAAGRALRNTLRLTEERHLVIPNAVVPQKPRMTASLTRKHLDIPPDSLVAVVVARLEARKGHRYLLEALEHLPKEVCDNFVLVVAGAGPERANLEARVESMSLNQRVRFLGEYSDPWSLYEIADVVVLPSVSHEDLPIVIIEAMAAGRPAIATRVAGTPELVVDGVTGRLVDPADPIVLAAALAEILSSPGKRSAMGVAARNRYASSYTPSNAVSRYVTAYARLRERQTTRRGATR
jgi:glycosyltransferase involved in cell wall biosynthesis